MTSSQNNLRKYHTNGHEQVLSTQRDEIKKCNIPFIDLILKHILA